MNTYIRETYGSTLRALGADLDTPEGFDDAIRMAQEKFSPVMEVHVTWIQIMKILVNLLTWRHMERVKGADV
jgi:hypothetical protein